MPEVLAHSLLSITYSALSMVSYHLMCIIWLDALLLHILEKKSCLYFRWYEPHLLKLVVCFLIIVTSAFYHFCTKEVVQVKKYLFVYLLRWWLVIASICQWTNIVTEIPLWQSNNLLHTGWSNNILVLACRFDTGICIWSSHEFLPYHKSWL